MASKTLLQLRTAIRDAGDYSNASGIYTNTPFPDDVVTRYVNEALAELYEIVSDQFQGYYDTTATAVTVAGTQTVNLPASFYELRALDRQVETERYVPLRRINLIEQYRLQGRGAPLGYMLHGGTAPGTVRLFPIPDAVYTLRFTYEPLFTPLALDADSFDFRNGWEELVIQAALLRMDMREERSIGERMAMIERAKARIIGSAAKRNSAEPEYLSGWGGVEDLL